MTTTGGDVTSASQPAARVRTVALLGPDGATTRTVLGGLAARAGAETLADPSGGGLACTVLDVDGVLLHLLHLTGRPDAEAEVQAALRASDALVLVLSAGGGLDPRTAQLWEQCAATSMPRAVVVTGLDAPRADFDEIVALCERLLGDELHPLHVPMHDDNGAVAGVLDLVGLRVRDWSEGAPVERAPDPEHHDLVEGRRSDLVEAVLAGSEDDRLLDRYLDGATIDPASIRAEFARAVRAGRVQPVLAVQPPVGTDELLELLTSAFPSPLDAEPPAVTRPDGSPAAALTLDPAGPLAAEVCGPAGESWLVRVRSGTLRPGATARATGHDRPGRDLEIGEVCGSVLCTVALDGVATGDTLSATDDPLLLSPWDVPHPLTPVSLTPSDDVALRTALEQLARRDPTVRLEQRAGQLLLWCLDDEHVSAVLAGLAAAGRAVDRVEVELDDVVLRLGVEVPTATVRPVLRELRRWGAQDVFTRDDDERDIASVSATVSEHDLPGLAAGLRAASVGTARLRRAG